MAACLIVGVWIGTGIGCDGQAPHIGVGFWLQGRGPYGGCLTDLIAGRSSELYARADKELFLHSRDGGATWERMTSLSSGLPNQLVLTPEGNLLAGTSQGVVLSSDGGLTWTPTLTGPVLALAALRRGTLLLAAVGFNRILRSLDGGHTWEPRGDLPGVRAFLDQPDGSLLAATYEGVFRSTDEGQSWSFTPGSEGIYVELASDSRGNVFAGGRFLLRSIDHGASWETIVDAKGGAGSIVVDSKDRIFVSIDSELMRSLDGGKTWDPVPIPGSAGSPLLGTADGRVYVQLCGEGGLYGFSDGGESWRQVPLPLLQVSELVADPVGRLFARTNEGMLRSLDGARAWTRFFSIRRGAFLFGGSRNDLWVAGEDTLHHSTDGGRTWTSTLMTFHADSNRTLQSIAVDSAGSLYAATWACSTQCDKRVYRSDDDGISWKETNLASSGYIAAGAAGHVVVGTGYDVFVSRDGGVTWDAHEQVFQPGSLFVLRIGPGGEVLAGTYDGLHRSTDGGETWTRMPVDAQIRSIAFAPNGMAVVAGPEGAYLGTQDRSSWIAIGPDSGDWVRSVAIGPAGFVYAGIDGQGIVRSREPL